MTVAAAAAPSALAPVTASPEYVISAFIDAARITADDVVVDLGCSDGRGLIEVARRTGARCIGVEINAEALQRARAAVHAAGLSGRVEILEQDLLAFDVTGATVIYTYLLPKGLEQLAPRLLAQAAAGCRIVTYQFTMPGWQHLLVESVATTSGRPGKLDVSQFSKIHLYRTPSGDADAAELAAAAAT